MALNWIALVMHCRSGQEGREAESSMSKGQLEGRN